ncbi:MAG: hypothetical protein AB1640_13070 [bacterium]
MRSRARLSFLGLVSALSAILPAAGSLSASEEISILLTSNLQGRFALQEQGQSQSDPLLVLARGMLAERRAKKIPLYLDLGNSFYPGSLSKFSSGSVVMDYLGSFSCDATLVSSMDLQIGLDNLQDQQKNGKTRLLSANLLWDAKPLFDPYVLFSTGRTTLGILGVSSTNIRFDIAEKKLYTIRMEEGFENLSGPIEEIRQKGAASILVLSGLTLPETISLLGKYKQIGMAICGGDNTGDLYGSQATRIEMADGRPIVMLPQSAGFYVLDLLVDSRLAIRNISWRSIEELSRSAVAGTPESPGPAYADFERRLSLWKRQYRKEEDAIVTNTEGLSLTVDDTKLACLLRDRFDCEVSVIDKNTLVPSTYQGEVTHSHILDTVTLDYNVFVYKLTGAEIRKLLNADKTLLINGIEDEKIQGYDIQDGRKYRVASTQPACEKMGLCLGAEIDYENTWQTVSDLLLSDLQGQKVVFREDHRYLERRFRTTLDVRLSNYLDHSTIDKDDDTTPPPGQPSESYKKWGLENRADLAIYNNRHMFVLTPEVRYEKQDGRYLQNLLRGTLVYNLNLDSLFKPYQKSMFETALEEERSGFRPMLIRETAGVSMMGKVAGGLAAGRLGLGFEKRINDPVEPASYGLEAIGSFEYPIWDRLLYRFDLDSFTAVLDVDGGRPEARSEVQNGILLSINRYVGFSLKHRFFYYYSGEQENDYLDSQFLVALDLGMDFKFW